jgi:hypothetical protein
MAGVYDMAAAQNDLSALEDLFPPKSVNSTDVAGYTLQQVDLDDADLTLTYGVADNWLYATAGGDPAEVVGAAQSGPLTEANPRFAQVRRALRADGVNLFVDLEAGRQLVEQLATTTDRETYDREVRPFLTPMRALGGSSWVDGDGQSHGQLFLAIRG